VRAAREAEFQALKEECAVLRLKVQGVAGSTSTSAQRAVSADINGQLAKELEDTKAKLLSAERKSQRLKDVRTFCNP
jgi:hypothetical protein